MRRGSTESCAGCRPRARSARTAQRCVRSPKRPRPSNPPRRRRRSRRPLLRLRHPNQRRRRPSRRRLAPSLARACPGAAPNSQAASHARSTRRSRASVPINGHAPSTCPDAAAARRARRQLRRTAHPRALRARARQRLDHEFGGSDRVRLSGLAATALADRLLALPVGPAGAIGGAGVIVRSRRRESQVVRGAGRPSCRMGARSRRDYARREAADVPRVVRPSICGSFHPGVPAAPVLSGPDRR
jgi:hypothetical protein